jgi:hypothetical protein
MWKIPGQELGAVVFEFLGGNGLIDTIRGSDVEVLKFRIRYDFYLGNNRGEIDILFEIGPPAVAPVMLFGQIQFWQDCDPPKAGCFLKENRQIALPMV